MPLINQATVDTATTGKTKEKDVVWAKQTVTIGFHRRLNLKAIAMDQGIRKSAQENRYAGGTGSGMGTSDR